MIIKALIPCTRFEVDPDSNTRNILGAFNSLTSARFPCSPPWDLYVRLTEHMGPLELNLRVACLDDGREIATGIITHPPIQDPVHEYDFATPAGEQITFPAPGLYEIQLSGHGAVGQTLLRVQGA
jgi:hypothetical protein